MKSVKIDLNLKGNVPVPAIFVWIQIRYSKRPNPDLSPTLIESNLLLKLYFVKSYIWTKNLKRTSVHWFFHYS
jgi:hypothetical protein